MHCKSTLNQKTFFESLVHKNHFIGKLITNEENKTDKMMMAKRAESDVPSTAYRNTKIISILGWIVVDATSKVQELVKDITFL